MEPNDPKTFREFWPYYLGEHRLPSNRLLHYLGTALSLLLLGVLLLNQRWHLLPFVLLAGYGFAWVGHFIIEKNKPATFKYPLWSLLADYKMFFFAITGKLKKDLVKYL